MKSPLLFLCVIVPWRQTSLPAQVIMPQVMDGVYVKDEPPAKYEYNAFKIYYSLPQVTYSLLSIDEK